MRKYIFLLSLIFAITTKLFCRDIEIFVVDSEIDIPLEGAVVKIQGGATYTCGSSGNVKIRINDTETISLEIHYPGYEKQKQIIRQENKTRYVFALSAGGILENEELIVEGARQKNERISAGRSIALDRENLAKSSEIGAIEDIMSSIKLLPGVGFSGTLDAQPSIRGGSPGDMVAVMDGFYIDFPYHWGGSYSIFDPKIVESARLYHGVFSAKYGHTNSGLLEVSSKKPSLDEATFDLGLSTSALSMALSVPFFLGAQDTARGGIMLMGKVTYWDPFVLLVKGMSNFIDVLKPVKIVDVAPYIRCFGISLNYAWTNKVESTLNLYSGNDGVGALYENNSLDLTISKLKFKWDNSIAYATSSLIFYPVNSMSFKTTIGGGFHDAKMDADLSYEGSSTSGGTKEHNYTNITSFQAREDFDVDLTKGFFLSAGVEELWRIWKQESETNNVVSVTNPDDPSHTINIPYYYPDIKNYGFFYSSVAFRTIQRY